MPVDVRTVNVDDGHDRVPAGKLDCMELVFRLNEDMIKVVSNRLTWIVHDHIISDLCKQNDTFTIQLKAVVAPRKESELEGLPGLSKPHFSVFLNYSNFFFAS